MVYVSTSLGSCFWSQTQCPECPLRTFLSWVQSTWWPVVREEWGRGLTFTGQIGGLISQNMGVSCLWCCLRWRNWGLVACLMSSVSWEGLSCSLLPPDSPSDSLTGWALALVPEICSARGLGSQVTSLEPCPVTRVLGPGNNFLEGLWTQWDETGVESLGVCI